MKKIKNTQKTNFLKRFFIKLCRLCGFEILDQSNFNSNLFLGIYNFKSNNFVKSKNYFDKLKLSKNHNLVPEILQNSLSAWSIISNTQNQDDLEVPRLIRSLLPPFALIFIVLGSIISGVASPTEAAGIGALGAMLIAWSGGKLSGGVLKEATRQTAFITTMVFLILIGASIFSLVFRGLGGEEIINEIFNAIPGGLFGAMLLVMVMVFLLGFILDFIEISFVVVPIVGPVLMAMGADPLWLGIMLAVNLQTSFLTPPFGFALFYLRGIAPESIATESIYKGVIPFIAIQIGLLILMAIFPDIVTKLPSIIYS